jgi:hypothetical protein
MSSPQIYFPSGNLGKSFKVEIENKTLQEERCLRLRVYQPNETARENDDYQEDDFDELVLTLPVNQIWIGEVTSYSLLHYGAAQDPADYFRGNAIIVKPESDDNCYYFISDRIFSFHIPAGEEIQQFVADVGNNDVGYPYLVTTSRIYLLHESIQESAAVETKGRKGRSASRLPAADNVVYADRTVFGDFAVVSPYEVFYGFRDIDGKEIHKNWIKRQRTNVSRSVQTQPITRFHTYLE